MTKALITCFTFLSCFMALEWREDITLQIARPKTTPSRQISLSANGRFLAIALGNGADIWDTNDRLIALQPTYRLKSSAPIVWMKWFPKESCLICTHEDARVYIATFTQDGFSTVGFRTNGSHDTAKMAAILNERLIAVGYTHFVEIRLKTTGMLPSISIECVELDDISQNDIKYHGIVWGYCPVLLPSTES